MCLSNNAKRPCSSAIISVRMEVMSVSQVSLCQALGQLAAAGGGGTGVRLIEMTKEALVAKLAQGLYVAASHDIMFGCFGINVCDVMYLMQEVGCCV